MAAYCLFDNVTVNDPEALAEYSSGVGPIVAAHGGRYLAAGGRIPIFKIPFEDDEGPDRSGRPGAAAAVPF